MEGDKKITRRQLISPKSFVKTALVGAGISAVLNRELNLSKELIKVGSNTFIPIYEDHLRGVNPEQIPDDTTVLFRELSLSQALLKNADALTLLQTESVSYVEQLNFRSRAFPDPILDKAAKNGIAVMLGDVDLGEYNNTFSLKTVIPLAMPVAALLGGLAALYLSNFEKTNVTRRKFLESMGTVSALWGSVLFTHFLTLANLLFPPENQAAKRVIGRIAGLNYHLHPENLNVFFRNAVMANKMLAVARLKSEVEQKPQKLSFIVESGHSGLEDLLLAGEEFCKNLILAYPKPVLEGILEANGNDIENFCSSRLIAPASDSQTDKIIISSDQIYRDQEMERMLRQKIGRY